MTICYVVAVGLGLGSLEVEQTTEEINLVILLFDSPALLLYLLKESLEYMQLELGLSKLVLEAKFSLFGKLVILYWLILL